MKFHHFLCLSPSRPILPSEHYLPSPTATPCVASCVQCYFFTPLSMSLWSVLDVFSPNTPVSHISICFRDQKITPQHSVILRDSSSTYGKVLLWHKFRALRVVPTPKTHVDMDALVENVTMRAACDSVEQKPDVEMVEERPKNAPAELDVTLT